MHKTLLHSTQITVLLVVFIVQGLHFLTILTAVMDFKAEI